MGMWGRLRLAARILSTRSVKMSDIPAIAKLFGGEGGRSATEETAKNLSAVWRAATLLSTQVGSLPAIVYRRASDGGPPVRAPESPIWRIIHDEPNEYQTPPVFFEALMWDALFSGNAFAEIERDGAGRPVALHPIPWRQIDLTVQPDGAPLYRQVGKPTLQAADVIHFPGAATIDGVRGLSVIQQARRSLGHALALEEFGSSFFHNGAWPGMVFKSEKALSEAAAKRFVAGVQNYLGGPTEAFKAYVLEDGMELVKGVTINPNDAQFLESRQFSIEEVARWFNVPPHKLGHKPGERPGGNLEASQIEYLTDSLRPWLVRIEKELKRKLFSAAERMTFYAEFLVDAILRTDASTRHTIHEGACGGPYKTVDEVRREENLGRVPGGDKLREKVAAAAPAPAPARAVDLRVQVWRAWAIDTARRYVRREAARLRKAASGDPRGFGGWAEAFYRNEVARLIDFLEPLARHWLNTPRAAGAVARAVALEYVEESREETMGLPMADLAAAADRLARSWEQERADELVSRLERALERKEGTDDDAA